MLAIHHLLLLAKMIFWFSLVITPIWGFSTDLYDDFLFYGKYTKLSACITENRLFERFMNKGGCDLVLCRSPRMANVEIVKVRNAPVDENGTGFIALNHDTKQIIVSFRGSTTTSDWMSDFEIVFADYVPRYKYLNIPECKGCKVHRGFYKHLNSITTDIIKPIESFYQSDKYKNYSLVLVGHSLGGSLATLIGIEFRVQGYKPLIYTYGAPKLFNEEMMSWVNEVFEIKQLATSIAKHERVTWGLIGLTHEGDFIPSLPPGFRQAGLEFRITKKDLPHTKEDVEFLGTSYMEETKEKTNQPGKNSLWQFILDALHAYEHRTYFMTINKCADPDFIQPDV